MQRWTLGLLMLVFAGCASSGSGAGSTDRNLISLAEIEASSASNAYELIQTRRPTWLRTRGTQSFREQGQVIGGDRDAAVLPGGITIMVYMENARLGDVSELRTVPLSEIRSVRFLDAAAATQRWGGGHTHGAILLSRTE